MRTLRNLSRAALPASLLAAALAAAPAQDGPPGISREVLDFDRKVAEAFREGGGPGNYAAVLRTLEETEAPPGSEQMAATWLSFAGEHRAAQETWDRMGEAARTPKVALPGEGSLVDAVPVIVELARAHRIVMINEAHHVPQHRELTRRLLAPLHELGFEYLALETLTNDPAFAATGHPFETTGYPTFDGGFYSMEPAFGELIRTALRLGFRLVPYEARQSDLPELSGIERREQAQADHLTRFLESHPGEKVLVHLGYAHLYEKPVGETPWMCARLKAMVGEDPLTVDQTVMIPRTDAALEDPRYVAATERWSFSVPSVLLDGEGQAWSAAEPGFVDLTVFHPRFTFVNDRPTWLRDSGARSAVVLRDVPPPAPGSWRLLQALAADEDPERSVPVDQFVLRPGNAEPTLYLPDGRFSFRLLDAFGEILWEEDAP